MALKYVAPWLLAMAATFAVTAPTAVAENVVLCSLQLLDERGLAIEDPVTLCRDDRPESCLDLAPSEASSLGVEVKTVYQIDGEGHGPVTAKPKQEDEGTCTITVPRKASVEVTFDTDMVSSLEASFYRLDEGRELRRAATRATFDRATTLRIAAGSYVLSLAARGWAPDLRALHADPGSLHRFNYRQLDGWSAVLWTIADSDATAVCNAEIEIRSLPGFDVPGHDDLSPRRLLQSKSDTGGLAVVSGLRVPMASAIVRHKRFLDATIPAFSSDLGTFRVFEARLHTGGRLEARVLNAGLFVPDARCELTPPYQGGKIELGETLHETRADALGICRAPKIPAGRYALKITLPDDDAAFTVQPLVMADGETSTPTIELQPITVSGRVYRGEEGASDYQVVFDRSNASNLDAFIYPAARTTTNEDGDYELVVWSPGDYLARVRTESTSATGYRVVALHSDDTVDFELAGAEIEGQVVDADGEPRPDAVVGVRWLSTMRSVVLDEEARFRVPFHEAGGVAEFHARETGFRKSKPVTVVIDPKTAQDPVTLVLHRRDRRVGRVVLASGRPAAGAWVRVYRLSSEGFPTHLERVLADGSGQVEVPAESGPARLFYGGPGCPLGIFDLPPATDEEPFEIQCRQPSHLLIRLASEDPELRDRAPILLRRDGIAMPPEVLQDHLQSLGMPAITDGEGRLSLVALEPGSYDLFHGKATSLRNVAAGHNKAFLAKVSLGGNETIELELTVDVRRR